MRLMRPGAISHFHSSEREWSIRRGTSLGTASGSGNTIGSASNRSAQSGSSLVNRRTADTSATGVKRVAWHEASTKSLALGIECGSESATRRDEAAPDSLTRLTNGFQRLRSFLELREQRIEHLGVTLVGRRKDLHVVLLRQLLLLPVAVERSPLPHRLDAVERPVLLALRLQPVDAEVLDEHLRVRLGGAVQIDVDVAVLLLLDARVEQHRGRIFRRDGQQLKSRKVQRTDVDTGDGRIFGRDAIELGSVEGG